MKPLFLCAVLAASVCADPSRAWAQGDQGFSSSRLTARHGWAFAEPDIAEDVPKTIFTFENAAGGRWWSSYLFVDVLRSWSEADANAKEVYGEWYPSISLRALAGKERSRGLLRDVSFTVGLNTGVRSTGPSPFAVLPGVTFDFNVPGFTFLSVGAFAYIDRGRFEGQPTDCTATTWQVTPSWSLPFSLGAAKLRTEGFLDILGGHANCEPWVLTEPRLLLDLSALWRKPGQVLVGAGFLYWHNKYGIANLEDKVLLPVVIWVM